MCLHQKDSKREEENFLLACTSARATLKREREGPPKKYLERKRNLTDKCIRTHSDTPIGSKFSEM